MILVGQAADGSLANDRYTVAGTADAGSSEANQTTVFMRLADAQSFFGLGEGVHQIIVRLPTDDEDLSRPVSLLRGALDLSALEVLPWTEILPELKGALDAKRQEHAPDRRHRLPDRLARDPQHDDHVDVRADPRVRRDGVARHAAAPRPRDGPARGADAGRDRPLRRASRSRGLILHGIGTVDFSSLTAGTDVLGVRMPSDAAVGHRGPGRGSRAS